MEQIEHLLNLPVQTLSVLAAGYLSYRLAYTGKDSAHSAVDVVFMVFVFALVAKISGDLLRIAGNALGLNATLRDTVAIALGMGGALLTSAVWRRWGERLVRTILSRSNVSHSDRTKSAWEAAIMKENVTTTSLVVLKKNGTTVMCERVTDFNKLPFGPCIMGPDGSIALYVTHRMNKDSDDWEACDPREHGDFGAEVTIIPASEIAEISMRAI